MDVEKQASFFLEGNVSSTALLDHVHRRLDVVRFVWEVFGEAQMAFVADVIIDQSFWCWDNTLEMMFRATRKQSE